MTKSYKDLTPEQQEAHKRRVLESNTKNQKQIPLKYKKEVAELLYAHAEAMGSTPVTWIKEAITEKYKKETGKDLQ